MKKLLVTSVMAFAFCSAASADVVVEGVNSGVKKIGSTTYIKCKGQGTCFRIRRMNDTGQEPGGSFLVIMDEDGQNTFTASNYITRTGIDEENEAFTETGFTE